jgi:hypothetical protein
MRRLGLMIATGLLALLLLVGTAGAAGEQLVWSAIGTGGGMSTSGNTSLQASVGTPFGGSPTTNFCSGSLCDLAEPEGSDQDPGGSPTPEPAPDDFSLYLPLLER